MSNIRSIIGAIASFSIGDPAVTTRDIDALDFTIKDGELPIRLLLPSTSGDSDFIGIGSLKSIEWKVQDLCLFGRVSAGMGIAEYDADMVDYLEDYLTVIKANRSPYSQSSIQGISIQQGPVLWNQVNYWGVSITLTIEEIL